MMTCEQYIGSQAAETDTVRCRDVCLCRIWCHVGVERASPDFVILLEISRMQLECYFTYLNGKDTALYGQ